MCLRRERERASAFRSMGLMVYVLKDRMDFDPVLSIVRTHLPVVKDVPGRCVARRYQTTGSCLGSYNLYDRMK